MAESQEDRPRHQQIAAELRAQIMSRDLPPRAQLPSVSQLVRRYRVANATVQQALTTLKVQGFITSRHGTGVFVRDRRSLVVPAETYFTSSPRGYSYQLLSVGEVQPPADVATALGLDAKGAAVLRHRLMRHDGEPVELSWSYYPMEIAAGTPLAGRAEIVGGAPQVLAELGYPLVRFEDRLSARSPTMEESKGLNLPDDVPVIRQFRVVYGKGDRLVEVAIQIKGTHLYELEYREKIERPLED
ncbi:MAG: GntR family transcriptional regulator [Pseudonocardiaceae bacterium]